MNKRKKIYFNDLRMLNKSLKNKIDNSIQQVLKNSNYILGNELIKFENQFSKFIKCKYSIGVSNGLDALKLSLISLNLKKNDEVIVPANSFFATALAVSNINAKPVFVDCNLDTYNICLEDLKKKISKKTKAIIIVHFLGNPVDIDKINYLKKKYNLVIIEDAAEAHGAKINNKMVGNLGDISCFSFYANKVLTSGEGGMVCTNNKKYYDRVNLLKNLGFSKPRFVHKVLAYNFRMSGIQAALGLSQLNEIERIIKKKIHIHKQYRKYLKNLKFIKFAEEEKNSRNVYWQVGIRIKNRSKNKLVNYLKKNKIDSRSFFYSIRRQPCLKDLIPKKVPKTLNSDILWNEGIYLPSSHDLKISEIKKICNLIKKFFE